MKMRKRCAYDTAEKYKDTLCYCCGRKDKLTLHHLRDIHLKTKSGKGVFNGYLLVCRDCHDFIELINNKHKRFVEEQSSGDKEC